MDVRRLVNQLVAEHGTRSPYTLCEYLGIYVLFHPLKKGARGFFQIEDGVKIIHIDNRLSDMAAKFVCAHELAHCLLHAGFNRIFLDSYTYMPSLRYENRADQFACWLLFGEPPLYREEYIYEWQLADCLNVPQRKLTTRLVQLGMYYC